MARPAAPLVLNTGNPVGGSVDRCWIVTADSDVVDLKGTGVTLGRVSSPVYADDDGKKASYLIPITAVIITMQHAITLKKPSGSG